MNSHYQKKINKVQVLNQLNFPPYNENDIQRWLKHIEFLFISNNITLTSLKYQAIIRLLPTEIICELPDNVQFDPNAFEKIRETIVNKIALSDRQREQMLSANKIGLENPKQFINKLEDPFVNKIALSDRQREQMLSANKIGLENPKQFINKLEDPFVNKIAL